MTPDLEIIIPLRHHGAALADAIASLAAQTDFEFKVLLSGRDPAADLRPLDKAQKQLAAAGIAFRCVQPPSVLERLEHWNWSHAQSSATWLKLLLPGERLAPEYIARLRQCRRENPRASLIRCDVEVSTEWGREIVRVPFEQTSLLPAEFAEHFPGRLDWISRSANMAYTRAAWQAVGGFAPQFPACAALHLNTLLALHHGVENLPETLVFVNSPDTPALNASDAGRVNVWLELWLIMRQARNYCLAARLPGAKKRLLPRALIAAGQPGW